MILKKILKRCKDTKNIIFVRIDNRRYLSDHEVAVYTDTPETDKWRKEDFLVAMMVDEEKWESYHSGEIDYPANIATRGTKLGAEPIRVVRKERSISIFTLPDGSIICAATSAVDVFSDINNKRYVYDDIEGMIVVLSDSFIAGMIRPMRTDLSELTKFGQMLSRGAKLSLDHGRYDEGGQMELE